MKITEFNHPELVHAVTMYPDDSHKTKIHRDWHISTDHHEGVVYFITVNDEIVKVGGSTQSIKSLVAQYCLNLEGKADPMFTRFPIYLMMLDLLCSGHRIDYYYIQVKPYTIMLPDLVTGDLIPVIANDFHGFETGYIQMVNDITGEIPVWNMAENGNSFSPELKLIWEQRREGLKEDGPHFDYQSFLSHQWSFL